MSRPPARLLSNQPLMPGVHLLWLDAPEVTGTAQPGQFVMVACGPGLTLRRPLTVHRVEGEKVALLVRGAGRGTHYLCRRQPGETIDLLGPRGRGFQVEATSRRLLLIAGGMGIAPLVFLAERALSEGRGVVLLHGAPATAALYPRGLLPPGVELHLATEDGSAGHKGMVTGLLRERAIHFDQAFAAGPVEMYRALQEGDLPALRGKPVQAALEVRLGCGFGACFGCTIPTRDGPRMVCQDGPVFDLGRVVLAGLRI